MNFIFLGLPGSGKSTQGNLLSKKLNLPWVSIGELLRDEFRKGTKDGIEANKFLSNGLNCPTEIKIRILEKILNDAKKGFILDNYPRTRDDLTHLKKFVKNSGKIIDAVFFLKTKESDVIERLIKKEQIDPSGEKRNDASINNIKKRIEKGFKEDADYILSYFNKLKKLIVVNGGENIEDVHRSIVSEISKL